jgi:hypothetical protein
MLNNYSAVFYKSSLSANDPIADIGQSEYAKAMSRTAMPLLWLSFALAACGHSEDYFSVANIDGDVESVDVHICEKVVDLPKSSHRGFRDIS